MHAGKEFVKDAASRIINYGKAAGSPPGGALRLLPAAATRRRAARRERTANARAERGPSRLRRHPDVCGSAHRERFSRGLAGLDVEEITLSV